jgi:DNA-binding transcriptional regulator YhcF (GntR family)
VVGVKDDGRPLFLRIAEQIENSIVDGTLATETQVPSTNELAAFHRINPATAAKGVNQLVADGILYKRRGIGMFVAAGARAQLLEHRRENFARQYLAPLMAEADKLGVTADELKKMIDVWGHEA